MTYTDEELAEIYRQAKLIPPIDPDGPFMDSVRAFRRRHGIVPPPELEQALRDEWARLDPSAGAGYRGSMTDDDPYYLLPQEQDDGDEFPQRMLMAKLTQASPDPVGELTDLFGVNRRTAERWNNGSSRMGPGLRVKLMMALRIIAEKQAELEAAYEGHERLFLKLAAGRLKADPID